MRNFKAKTLLKPYFFIPLIIIAFVVFSLVFWYLSPKKHLNIAVLDKTVPASASDSLEYLDKNSQNFRKHNGLFWILDYMKINNAETGKLYNYRTDYFGPELNENSEIESISSITEISGTPDMLYLSDAYGVELTEERGITSEEMNVIARCYSSGSVLIGEQDIMITDTDSEVVSQLQSIFGIVQTGWVGRYVQDLQDLTDVPYWAPDLWSAKYGQEWNCTGPGILLVSRDGDIIVLEEQTDFKSKNLLKISVENDYKKEFSCKSLNFYNWFELIEASQNTETIATFHFNVNSTGAEELAAVSDTTTFAAVTRATNEDGTPAYYFAGDFNDHPSDIRIHNFMFADSFYRLLSFDREGDISNFYWNFYEPMMKKIIKDAIKNPVKDDTGETHRISRVSESGFSVLVGNEWQDLAIKGFNINGEEPGTVAGVYSGNYSYYKSLVDYLGDMGGNCIRAYDLLPPEFYRALCEYNKHNENTIYLIQGIKTADDALSEDKSFTQTHISDTISAVHGGKITDPETENSLTYSYNASNYVIAYIIDPSLTVQETDALMSVETEKKSYSGTYISSGDNAVEAACASLCDYTLAALKQEYGFLVPVSICCDAQRLSGADWIEENVADYTYNLTSLITTDESDEYYFSSYSLSPDDKIMLDNSEAFSKNYSDSDGAYSYGGYIFAVQECCDGAVLIDRGGLSTNSNVFEEEKGINGLSEREQGEGIVRMIRSANSLGYIGLLVSDLNDNWCASSDMSTAYTLPDSDNGLWHDTADRAENTGVIAVEPIEPSEPKIELNDNGEKSLVRQIQISHNESYVYLTLLLAKDIDYDDNEMIIGIDTYQRNNGEYYFDKQYFANSLSGMEYIIKFESKLSASLYVSHSYNRNEGEYATKESYNAEYDLVSVLNYGNFTESNTHFYQAGVTVKIRIPWSMIGFADPAKSLVINGKNGDSLATTITDGMIFYVLVGDKESKDTAYIFPESKKSAGYKRLEVKTWESGDVKYRFREKESFEIIKRYFGS